MIKGLIGRKLGMIQVFSDQGRADAVTAIEAGPCTVVQVKIESKEGYSAVQLGFGQAKRVKSPIDGHVKELGNFKYLKELRMTDTEGIAVGNRVDASLFKAGDTVDVVGVSKGRGFAGVIKRHGFHGGPKTHGQSDRHRAPGSIGAGTSPGRVLKGKSMPGHMGGERVTVCRLKVVKVDTEQNLLLVKGAVPGAKNGMLIVRKTGG